ncbi:hypothetical protein P4910_23775 [Pantoea stewartii]|uniref:plasmid fertility inhibition factor family protein n=1 Tax=Pantoea stewartii TaxID=66269 RepID=UPI0023F63FBC|nr:hypothetical protein [Pantoea stewartii]MDF7788471.1 hypothetical protein [Pantoea stewartii]
MNSDPIFNEHPLLAACGICRIGREYGGFGDRVCHFSVGLRDGKIAWMKLSLHPFSEKWVVIVRKRPFLNAWARSGDEPQLSTGDETLWRNDYKFLRAEKGFLQGIHNPVPLALCDAHYEIEGGLPVLHTGFTDGLTRTIWLLANGAESFPVSVTSEESARLLYRGAGDRKTEPLSVALLHSLCT